MAFRLNGQSLTFCIHVDIGAEVTITLENLYTKIGSSKLQSVDKELKVLAMTVLLVRKATWDIFRRIK